MANAGSDTEVEHVVYNEPSGRAEFLGELDKRGTRRYRDSPGGGGVTLGTPPLLWEPPNIISLGTGGQYVNWFITGKLAEQTTEYLHAKADYIWETLEKHFEKIKKKTPKFAAKMVFEKADHGYVHYHLLIYGFKRRFTNMKAEVAVMMKMVGQPEFPNIQRVISKKGAADYVGKDSTRELGPFYFNWRATTAGSYVMREVLNYIDDMCKRYPKSLNECCYLNFPYQTARLLYLFQKM